MHKQPHSTGMGLLYVSVEASPQSINLRSVFCFGKEETDSEDKRGLAHGAETRSVEAKPKPQTSKAFAVWEGGNGLRG